MKPRLRLKGGVWSCVSVLGLSFPPIYKMTAGYGYTPKEAYFDWRAQR